MATKTGGAGGDYQEELERLYKGETLTEAQLKAICQSCKEILEEESNVVSIQCPVTIVGDIHGQFYDLLELFRIGKYNTYIHTQVLFIS